jgi:hypothetical protein
MQTSTPLIDTEEEDLTDGDKNKDGMNNTKQ